MLTDQARREMAGSMYERHRTTRDLQNEVLRLEILLRIWRDLAREFQRDAREWRQEALRLRRLLSPPVER